MTTETARMWCWCELCEGSEQLPRSASVAGKYAATVFDRNFHAWAVCWLCALRKRIMRRRGREPADA